MFDEPFSLFDEVLDLHSRWDSIADLYGRHAADLLSSSFDPGTSDARPDMERCADAMRHVAQYAAIRAILRDLESLLTTAQERSHQIS